MVKTKDVRMNGVLYRIVVEGPHTPAERLYTTVRKNGIWHRKAA